MELPSCILSRNKSPRFPLWWAIFPKVLHGASWLLLCALSRKCYLQWRNGTEDYLSVLKPRSRPLSLSYSSCPQTQKLQYVVLCGSRGRLWKVKPVLPMWPYALLPLQKLYWQTLWPSEGERREKVRCGKCLKCRFILRRRETCNMFCGLVLSPNKTAQSST
jgi:hypothetical protein